MANIPDSNEPRISSSSIDRASTRKPSFTKYSIVAIAALGIGILGSKYLIPPQPCPPCPPPPTVVIIPPTPVGPPPTALVRMDHLGVGGLQVNAPMARAAIKNPQPGDLLIVTMDGGGPVPDPAHIPVGSYTFRIETPSGGVREIEITANM